VLSFVSGSLRPVKSDVDQYLSQWYKSNSLIYVSPDHACWSDEESARKVRKNRFGKVEKGDVRGVGAMLRRYVFLLYFSSQHSLTAHRNRYLPQATTFITTKVSEWERENGDGKDPDETDEEDILADTNNNNNNNNADLDEMMANGEVLGMQSIRAPVGIALAHVN
jgi:histone deacetylase 6